MNCPTKQFLAYPSTQFLDKTFFEQTAEAEQWTDAQQRDVALGYCLEFNPGTFRGYVESKTASFDYSAAALKAIKCFVASPPVEIFTDIIAEMKASGAPFENAVERCLFVFEPSFDEETKARKEALEASGCMLRPQDLKPVFAQNHLHNDEAFHHAVLSSGRRGVQLPVEVEFTHSLLEHETYFFKTPGEEIVIVTAGMAGYSYLTVVDEHYVELLLADN